MPPTHFRPQTSASASASARSVSGQGEVNERRSRVRDGQPGARVRVRLRLRLTLSGGVALEAAQIRELLAGDLSSGGVFVNCQNPPQVGEKAVIEVCRPSGGLAFAAKGRVVWRRAAMDALGQPAGFGLSFDDLDLHNDAVCEGLLGLLKQQQALAAPRSFPERPGADLQDIQILGLDEIAREAALQTGQMLPREIAGFLEGFEQVQGRAAFLFRWAYEGTCAFTLSCVDPALRERVRGIKILLLMYSMLLDDTTDRLLLASGVQAPKEEIQRLSKSLETLRGLPLWGPSTDPSPEGDPYLTFAQKIAAALAEKTEVLGRYDEFGGLFRLDVQQLVQASRYQELLLRGPYMISETESGGAAPLGLPLLLSASVDLCASPSFDRREVGLLREILCHAQRMAHIGHLLSGWERRCEEGALGNAVVAHGLASGALTIIDVDPVSGPLRTRQLVARLKEARVEGHFLTEWLRERFRVRELSARLRTVDLDRLLGQHQQLMWQQLSKKGLV